MNRLFVAALWALLVPSLALAQLSPQMGAPTFTDPAQTRLNLGLGTASILPSTAFDAAGLATAEANRATAAEAVVAASVTAEVSRALIAEGVNATAITTETTARIAAVNGEATARVAGDTANTSAISTEASTARTAEGANATAITTEATTARNAGNLTSGTMPAAVLNGADVGGASALATKGTTARTQADHAEDFLGILDLGADRTGAVDAGAAASNLLAGKTVLGAPAQGFVPTGNYTIASPVNSQGRLPTWVVPGDVTVNAYNLAGISSTNLGNGAGAVVRPKRVNAWTFGEYDNANAFAVIANAGYDQPAQVVGLANVPSRVANTPGRDSVALYMSNNSPPANVVSSATYTPTTLVPGVAVNTANLQVGMFIDTLHTPKYTGTITGWAANGSSITVSGWFQMGNTAAGQTPTSSVGANINPVTGIWAKNTVTVLNANGLATSSTGDEIDVFNNLASYVHNENPSLAYPAATGQFIISEGTYNGAAGVVTEGTWYYGFESRSGVQSGFAVTASTARNPTYGYTYNIGSGTAFNGTDPVTGNSFFNVQGGSGNVAIGQGLGTGAITFRADLSGGVPVNGAQIIGSTGAGLGLRGASVSIGNTAGNPAMTAASPGSAVNFVQIQGNTTGNPAQIFANGTDTNISLSIGPKGSGSVISTGPVTAPAFAVNVAGNAYSAVNPTSGNTYFNISATSQTIGDGSGTIAVNYYAEQSGSVPVRDAQIVVASGSVFSIKSAAQFFQNSAGATGMTVAAAASAVNYVAFTGTVTTTPATMTVGGDATAGLTITAKSTGLLTLGSSANKLAFYGAAGVAKATPSGACAGNTGCQALRDALGSLGLIATGGVTN